MSKSNGTTRPPPPPPRPPRYPPPPRAFPGRPEIKFKARGRGRVKATRFVDLELPVSEKASRWQLDGYDTCEESGEDKDEEEDDEEGQQGATSEEDREEMDVDEE